MSLIRPRAVRVPVLLAALFSIAYAGAVQGSPGWAALPLPVDDIRRVKAEEARNLTKRGKAVLVDVRGESAYKEGHVKDALLIPLSEIGERTTELPRDKMILTYCS